jgi:signal transduction histidine kinase
MGHLQKILIVDDKAENLFALRQILNQTRAEIIEAPNGNDALIASLNHEFAVAILDVQMPEMSGYELAECLRKDKKTRPLPLIFLSAVFSDEYHIFKGYEVGAVDFIAKPFDPRILIGKVNVFLELDRQRALLRNARDELELRVRERTAELQIAYSALEHHSAQLNSMNQELQEFAFIASHDLREPLRKIQTFGNMLVRKHKESFNPEGRDYMERMIKAANRMSELLRSLLDYSRTGTSFLDYEPVSLTEVARDAASDLEILIKKAKGSVEISDMPTVEADATLMRQLFQNFIGNSMKYRKESEPPSVKIYGRIEDGTCQVMIEDNGIGFDECYSHKIFKPFERLHGKNTPYSGTGMGLAICKKIVNRHGGEITVRSIPEQGTTFCVSLPIEQEKGA